MYICMILLVDFLSIGNKCVLLYLWHLYEFKSLSIKLQFIVSSLTFFLFVDYCW